MSKRILLVALCLLTSESFSQINSSFEVVLKKILEDSIVSSEVFNKKFNGTYIFINQEFAKQIVNYDSLNKYYPMDSALTNRLFDTRRGTVWLFHDPDVLAIRSKNEIDRVIVLDKYKNAKSKARVVFHTTNCYSKIAHKYSKQKQTFKTFDCDLVLDDNTWVVRHVKISLTKFKSIVD